MKQLLYNVGEGIKKLKETISNLLKQKEQIVPGEETPELGKYMRGEKEPQEGNISTLGKTVLAKIQDWYNEQSVNLERNFSRRGLLGSSFYAEAREKIDDLYQQRLSELRDVVVKAHERQQAKIPVVKEAQKELNYQERFKEAAEQFQYIGPDKKRGILQWFNDYPDIFNDPTSPYYSWAQESIKKLGDKSNQKDELNWDELNWGAE